MSSHKTVKGVIGYLPNGRIPTSFCNEASNAHTTGLTHDNATVSGRASHVDSDNCKVSYDDANVLGHIRHADCCITNLGSRIDGTSQFTVNVKHFIVNECGSAFASGDNTSFLSG